MLLQSSRCVSIQFWWYCFVGKWDSCLITFFVPVNHLKLYLKALSATGVKSGSAHNFKSRMLKSWGWRGRGAAASFSQVAFGTECLVLQFLDDCTFCWRPIEPLYKAKLNLSLLCSPKEKWIAPENSQVNCSFDFGVILFWKVFRLWPLLNSRDLSCDQFNRVLAPTELDLRTKYNVQ